MRHVHEVIFMEYPTRKLHRLKCWDYSQPGYYHVTICTRDKRKLLCDIRQDGLAPQVIPNKMGNLIMKHWNSIPQYYPNVKTDYFCVMPNHIHGILIIESATASKGASLGDIVRAFKSVTTREYNALVSPDQKNTLWQKSFYDEIIRNDQMLQAVRNYIYGNPSKWLEDDLYIK